VIEQVAISLLGVGAIALTQSRDQRRRRWASVLGLLAQPAWFYAEWVAHQWGMLFLACIYTGVWCYGFYVNWIRGSS
jgi:hypothetical protein